MIIIFNINKPYFDFYIYHNNECIASIYVSALTIPRAKYIFTYISTKLNMFEYNNYSELLNYLKNNEI